MDPGQAPHLRLIINPTSKNPDIARTATIWNPEDELHGYLDLSTSLYVRIDRITIYFEGFSRNWISEKLGNVSRVVMAERKFLSQAHDISPSIISHQDSVDGSFNLKAPFHFIISRAIPCTNPDSLEQCLKLPPSLELGEQLIDQATGTRFAQPRITYCLRAAVNFITESPENHKIMETSLPLIIAPYTEELPPTATDDFPTEFKERESKVLWPSLIGGKLGVMAISLQEPAALVYDNSSTGSSTTALMRLEFQPASTNLANIPKSPPGISFTVQSLVRVKTFYSVRSFPQFPSQKLMESFQEMRLRDSVIKLGTQQVRHISWGYRFNLDDGRIATPGSHSDISISSPNVPQNGNSQMATPCHRNGKWISNWSIPIDLEGRLLPTFCSSLVARFYTIIIRLKVGGARQEIFDLEVPLQIIHTPPRETHLPTTVEDIREHFLEARRASETSWFNEGSEDSEHDPPQYYP